jgi:hypothetical protein
VEFENLEPRLLLSADLSGIAASAVAVDEQTQPPHSTPEVIPAAQPPVVNMTAPERKDATSPFAGQSIHLNLDGAQDAGHREPVPVNHTDVPAIATIASLTTGPGGFELDQRDLASHVDGVHMSALLSPDIDYAEASGAALNASLKIADVEGSQMLQLVDKESGVVLRQEALDADKSVLISGPIATMCLRSSSTVRPRCIASTSSSTAVRARTR